MDPTYLTASQLERHSQLWRARVKREIAERQAAGNPSGPPVGPDDPVQRMTSERRKVLLNSTYMGEA